MTKDKHHIIAEIETFLQRYDYEFQSIGNEIKIYLDDSEIYIVIDKYINIYDYDKDQSYSYPSLDRAIMKLKSIVS
mgnify:CR=1 FL=1|tara:strand:- start:304 stop:531 length:228 start_codon:yes stop_codon:yes gene_type:complete